MRQLSCYLTATLGRAAQRFDTLAVKRHPVVIVGSGVPLFERPGTSANHARSTTRTIDSGLTITHFSRGLS
ncbi:hypothetical protein [Streptomyces sp. NPDC001502]|uniref:hypothetical protein n=1 Tax=Streptomyces sp. NPDC001502 TaxID=3364578 RepID=UPI0036B932A0